MCLLHILGVESHLGVENWGFLYLHIEQTLKAGRSPIFNPLAQTGRQLGADTVWGQ